MKNKAEKVVCDGSDGEPMGIYAIRENHDGMEPPTVRWYGNCPYCSCDVGVTGMGIMEQHFDSN